MSILIKGMEMPTACCACPCSYDNICAVINKRPTFTEWYESKPYWCPLIELPPHGDLIDRDALMKDGWLSLHKVVMRMGGYAIHELPLANPSIPVVIEKENC